MKKTIITTIVSLLIVSCGGTKKEQNIDNVLASNDVKQLKELRKQIESEKENLSAKIEKINTKILELEPNTNQPLISVQKLSTHGFKHYFEVQGNVKTKKNVLIYPETPGQLVSIFVKVGSRVRKGQVLAKIDNGGLDNQLSQLQIQADLAKTTFERQQNLWNQKIGSEMQYLQAKANYEAQQKALQQMKKTLSKYTITAPFSGVIDEVFKEQGVIVAPGMGAEIFRIVNLGKMYIETDIPETYLKNVKRGKEVLVNFTVLGKEIKTKVSQVGSYINPMNRTFKVEINVPSLNGMVKPNMSARLKINDYTNKDAITIPQSIISENANGEQYVYVLTDRKNNKGIAKKVIIETGKSKDGIVEVLKGLSVDNEIVVEGARTVKDGQEVTILSNEQ